MSQSVDIAHRLRVIAVCTVLTGLVFLQEPGRIVTDTKLDLVVAPVSWLGRALHLWEPAGWLGQVQNQAYGYLFPMGPFFAVGDLLSAPPWIIQRAWAALLICVALVGVYRLSARLGIGSPTTQLAAGVIYALSPRFLTTLGPISAETLPMAMAPWIVLPLVVGASSMRLRTQAARSGLAVFACGAVNAVATLAVLPIALVYLLTRARSRARTVFLMAWLGAVAAACLWWVVPLVLLGSVSPPFLDWIESARITTLPTNLVESLRGTSHWVAYSASADGPFWRGGWLLVTNPVVVLDTVLIACLGIFGLARRDLAERRFLTLTALLGLLLITFGHVGALEVGWSAWAQGLLDGALAPFRNVHKFDPILRLPLALAAGHALCVLVAAIRRLGNRALPALAAGVAVVVLGGSMSPLLLGDLAPKGAFEEIPGYWERAAAWLADRDDGAALVIPAASFGTFYWGDPRDEPLQPLAGSPWTVRDAVPLAPAGQIRLLDEIERRLGRGDGGPGLAAAFRALGSRYVIVRNDLDYARAGAARPVLVHEALAETPGVRREVGFGPPVGGGSRPGLRVDAGLDLPYSAIEIFSVDTVPDRVSVAPLAEVLLATGGPEALTGLGDAGLAAGGPIVLAGDAPSDWGTPEPPTTTVVTDTYRQREVDFGRVNDNASQVLSPDDSLRLGNPARDYLPWADVQPVSALPVGAVASASSSLSDAGTPGGTQPDRSPWAALDRDPTTSWSSSEVSGALDQWLEVLSQEPVRAAWARLLLKPDAFGLYPTQLIVTTDGGQRVVNVHDPDHPVLLPIVGGETQSLRIQAARMSDGGTGLSFVVAELELPGVDAERPLVVPGMDSLDGIESADGTADFVLLTADQGRNGCVNVGRRPLCAEGLERASEQAELDRVIGVGSGTWRVSGTAVARPGPVLDALLAPEGGAVVTASSRAVTDPRGRPQLVMDGNRGTGWTAASGDSSPELRVDLGSTQVIKGIDIFIDSALAASAPTMVQVTSEDGAVRTGRLDEEGQYIFQARLSASAVSLTFPKVRPEGTFDPFTGRTDLLPVGLSELSLIGVDTRLARGTAPGVVRSECGEGPEIRVDGSTYPTAVEGPAGSVEELQPQQIRVCGTDLALLDSTSRVQMLSSSTWRPASLLLARPGSPMPATSASGGASVELTADRPDRREVSVGALTEPAVLSVLENANRGWQARLDGTVLPAVTLDGWHQGWVLPEGPAGTVVLEFLPQRTYRFALVVGLGLVVGLLLAAMLPERRTRTGRIAAGETTRLDRVFHLLVLTVIGGLVGALAAALGWFMARRRRRPGWWSATRELAGPLLLLLAGAAFVRAPWGSADGYAGNLAWPQVVGVLAVAIALAPLATAPRPQSLGGPLDHDPAEPRHDETQRQRDRQHEPEATGERFEVEQPEDHVKEKDVPQEQAVRDTS